MLFLKYNDSWFCFDNLLASWVTYKCHVVEMGAREWKPTDWPRVGRLPISAANWGRPISGFQESNLIFIGDFIRNHRISYFLSNSINWLVDFSMGSDSITDPAGDFWINIYDFSYKDFLRVEFVFGHPIYRHTQMDTKSLNTSPSNPIVAKLLAIAFPADPAKHFRLLF